MKGWERCKVCDMGLSSANPKGTQAYLDCEYTTGLYCRQDKLRDDTIALLKEQKEQVQQWTKEIADNQLAHAPKDSYKFMSLDEHLENEYKMGIWDGLQIAWNIISEGR